MAGESERARDALLRAIAIAPNKQQQEFKDKFKKLFPNDSLAESNESLAKSKEARR